MSEFKVCPNGHYYQENLNECPYCPKPTSTADKTRIDNPGSMDKTQIFSGGSAQDLNKTQIFSGNVNQPAAQSGTAQKNAGRKLVGWLVNFTMDPNGVDFKLYEGRNIIGSDAACDIVISGDSTVSLKHLTILHRMGVYKFKDEMSTNGTFINGEFMEEGNLSDGCIIKVGNTELKFRTI